MSAESPTAQARRLAAEGATAQAEAVLARLLAEASGEAAAEVRINRDRYSLNSLNGFARLERSGEVFFKFHQEEGEEATLDEYYAAGVLEAAGYAVDKPLHASHRPGRQVLIYARRRDPRLSELCRALERAPDPALEARVIVAQEAADARHAAIALATLRPAAPHEAERAAIHRLFHHRLIDPDAPERPGGRARRFYLDAPERVLELPGADGPLALSAGRLASARWRIDGRDHAISLEQALEAARITLAPARFAGGPVITAHGDAHNANVWAETTLEGALALRFFDPAFAGVGVPALLAEVKASFHNILAHPFWLYDPDLAAERFSPRLLAADDGVLEVETGFEIGPLRRAFLVSKAERFWRPLLAGLAAERLLAPDWEATVRAALFCCPTLVMNLTPGGARTPESALIGFSQAIRCAAAPTDGADDVTDFIARARP